MSVILEYLTTPVIFTIAASIAIFVAFGDYIINGILRVCGRPPRYMHLELDEEAAEALRTIQRDAREKNGQPLSHQRAVQESLAFYNRGVSGELHGSTFYTYDKDGKQKDFPFIPRKSENPEQ